MCLCHQGEAGSAGLRGPEGSPGIGTQGEKVNGRKGMFAARLASQVTCYHISNCVPNFDPLRVTKAKEE